MSDRQRLENGLPIRSPRRKQPLKNDSRLQKCFEKSDNGVGVCLGFRSDD